MTAQTPRPLALVTGAARGIGAAIALRLAQEGCDLVLLDLAGADCEATATAVRALGVEAHARSVDVADEQSVDAAVQSLDRAPSVLVNNAGMLREHVLSKTTLAEWERTLDVNLRGTFLMCRAVAPRMRAALA